MRALVLAGGESWRLPGPVPKPFRLLGERSVVAHVVLALEQAEWIDQIEVCVRHDHLAWAERALHGYEADILPRATMGPAARVRDAQRRDEPLVVVLGDTLVTDHAAQLVRIVANQGSRPRVLVDDSETDRLVDLGSSLGLASRTLKTIIDVGSYYVPANQYLPALRDESVLAALLGEGPVDPIYLMGSSRWRDVGTPEGFAAAELALAEGRL